MGRIPGGIRLPLVPLSAQAEATVLAALKDAGLL
jgi:dihydrodipicolinate synthase/N-acetylneuraminate lyase